MKDEFAFPSKGPLMTSDVCGMTLRDYFAAKALQGMLSDHQCPFDQDELAEAAYIVADAMLKVRNESAA